MLVKLCKVNQEARKAKRRRRVPHNTEKANSGFMKIEKQNKKRLGLLRMNSIISACSVIVK